MLDEFGPERVRNTPISEMALVGAGIGAAMQGVRPVVEVMYEDVLTLSCEQIVNQAAKHRYMSGGQVKVPLTVRTQGGAGWSPGAQHAQQLEAWFVHVPGLKVVFASTPADVRGLLYTSIYDDNPVVFFEHRTLYGIKEEVPDELEPIELGKARVHREGEDVTVVATGRLVHEALRAAEEGEPLYELDTDKVTQEVEADASGVLLRIAVEEGEVEVGRTIALIGQEGESVPDEAPTPAPEEPAKPEAKRAAPAAQTLQQTVARSDGRGGGRIKASPLARRIARERGVELSSLQGTGPEGRIVAEDVERAAAGPAPAAAVPAPPFEAEVVPLTSLRRTVARRMTEAWQAPAFQISMSADMTRALAIRARLVERGDTPKPTISDLLTKVSAAALMRHREVNALYEGDAVRLLASADIGMADATERGLLVRSEEHTSELQSRVE